MKEIIAFLDGFLTHSRTDAASFIFVFKDRASVRYSYSLQEMLKFIQERPLWLTAASLFRAKLSWTCGLPNLFAQTEPPYPWVPWVSRGSLALCAAELLSGLELSVFEKYLQRKGDLSDLPTMVIPVHHRLIACALFSWNISCLVFLFFSYHF